MLLLDSNAAAYLLLDTHLVLVDVSSKRYAAALLSSSSIHQNTRHVSSKGYTAALLLSSSIHFKIASLLPWACLQVQRLPS